MKNSDIKIKEFIEFKLNQESMNKLRGGDGPAYPPDPPEQPTGK